jgi:hypothetical protein
LLLRLQAAYSGSVAQAPVTPLIKAVRPRTVHVGFIDQANDTLRRDRRNAKPSPANPISIIAQVDGSGTPICTVKLSASAPLPHVHT